jgi:hypothetical protein
MSKRIIRYLFVLLLALPAVAASSCFAVQEPGPGFGIYLIETGEPVITEEHIAAYYTDMRGSMYGEGVHAIELNKAGIERWNSFITYEDIPKLKQTLYQKDFVVRVYGREVYRGEFYSMVSSMSYNGVVILDALIELSGDNDKIYIAYGYPSPSFATGGGPVNSPAVIGFMKEHGLLR